MIPALPMAQPVRGGSALGVTRNSSFDQGTPVLSTVARAARTLASTVAKFRSAPDSACRSQAIASTLAVPPQRPLLSQKPCRLRPGCPDPVPRPQQRSATTDHAHALL